MIRNRSLRAPLAALVLAASLVAGSSHAGGVPAAPFAVRGHARSPARPHTVVGVLMAIACGASMNIARMAPIPIVIVVGGATCLVALLDAWVSPDN